MTRTQPTWGEAAGAVIYETIRKAQQDGVDRCQWLKLIDAAYPFGQRAYFPYKAWLKARREAMDKFGLGKKRMNGTPDIFAEMEP